MKYRDPMIRWINDADPYEDDPGITKETVRNDRTVYLVADEDADGPEAVERWVETNYEALFESELAGWYADPSLWPEPRTLEVFHEWFEVEHHSIMVDTVQDKIRDEEI